MKKWLFLLSIIMLCLIISSCIAHPEMTGFSSTTTSSSNSFFSSETIISSPKNTPSSSETTKSVLFGDVTYYTMSNPITYTDEHAQFSVDYPSEWKTVIVPWEPATSDFEGSPDNGIKIFIEGNENEFIYVFGSEGKASGYLSYPQEDFITKALLRGRISFTRQGEEYQIAMILDESFHGAILHLGDACLTRNKAQILGILKSIKILSKE